MNKFLEKIIPDRWLKASPANRLMVQNTYAGNIAADRDYEKFSRESYLKNTIVFRCIGEIARSAATPKWQLWDKGVDGSEPKLNTTHKFNEVLNRANPNESFNFMVLRAVAFLAMMGNSYIERVVLDTSDDKTARELYVLRPDRVTVLVDKERGVIRGYEYKVGNKSKIYKADPITGQADLLQLKLFHPANDFYGVGSIEPASREIDSSNDSTDWNMNLLRNMGRPGLIFKMIGDISDEEFTRFQKHLNDTFAGPDNVGKNLVITGLEGTDVKPYTMTPAEMEWLEGNKELARGIARACNVPPQILGIPGDNTYSNYQEARLAFWEETIIFYLRLFKNEMNNWLFDEESGLFLDYNTDDISALEKRWETKWKRAGEADFLTINEKRKMTGHDDIGEEGNVILVPANMLPLGMSGEEGGNDSTGDDKGKGDAEKKFEALLDRLEGIDKGNINGDKEEGANLLYVTDEEYEFLMDIRGGKDAEEDLSNKGDDVD